MHKNIKEITFQEARILENELWLFSNKSVTVAYEHWP